MDVAPYLDQFQDALSRVAKVLQDRFRCLRCICFPIFVFSVNFIMGFVYESITLLDNNRILLDKRSSYKYILLLSIFRSPESLTLTFVVC